MNNVYVYAENNCAAIGFFIGVCIINETLKPARLNSLYKAYRYYKELVKEQKLRYIDYIVNIEDVNAYGLNTSYTEILDGLLLSLSISEQKIIRNRHCPYSTKYKIEVSGVPQSPGLRLTQYIVRSRRIGWIKKVANGLYPQFGWNDNYGLDTYQHAKKVMLYGSDMTIHTKSFLLNLGKYWLQGLREYDSDVIFGHDYSTDPIWWSRIFPETSFLQCLTPEEKLEVEYLAGHYHSENIELPRYFKDYAYI